MRRLLVTSLVFGALLLSPRPAAAWGFEAHKYIMGRAILLLPKEIRPFFQKFQTSIVEHAIDPDLWRTAGWTEESPRHFLDMDSYGPHPFANLPHDYDEAVRKFGKEFVEQNGTIPWRTEEIFGKLVEAFTQKAGYSRENIKFFSSVIAHYTSDAHVPFHAAKNHDGQLTGQHGIHSRFESELFERYRGVLVVKPQPVVPIADPREFIFETLTDAFTRVDTLLEADRTAVLGRDFYDAAYFKAFFGKARPIIEERLADSITDVASMITAAWIKAGRPAVPLDVTRPVRPVRRQ